MQNSKKIQRVILLVAIMALISALSLSAVGAQDNPLAVTTTVYAASYDTSNNRLTINVPDNTGAILSPRPFQSPAIEVIGSNGDLGLLFNDHIEAITGITQTGFTFQTSPTNQLWKDFTLIYHEKVNDSLACIAVLTEVPNVEAGQTFTVIYSAMSFDAHGLTVTENVDCKNKSLAGMGTTGEALLLDQISSKIMRGTDGTEWAMTELTSSNGLVKLVIGENPSLAIADKTFPIFDHPVYKAQYANANCGKVVGGTMQNSGNMAALLLEHCVFEFRDLVPNQADGFTFVDNSTRWDAANRRNFNVVATRQTDANLLYVLEWSSSDQPTRTTVHIGVNVLHNDNVQVYFAPNAEGWNKFGINDAEIAEIRDLNDTAFVVSGE